MHFRSLHFYSGNAGVILTHRSSRCSNSTDSRATASAPTFWSDASVADTATSAAATAGRKNRFETPTYMQLHSRLDSKIRKCTAINDIFTSGKLKQKGTKKLQRQESHLIPSSPGRGTYGHRRWLPLSLSVRKGGMPSASDIASAALRLDLERERPTWTRDSQGGSGIAAAAAGRASNGESNTLTGCRR